MMSGISTDASGALIPYRYRQFLFRWLKRGLLVFGMFLIIFPLYWAFATSIRGTPEVSSFDLLPNTLTLEHYHWLLTQTSFFLWFGNSTIISIGVILLTVVAATLGGYGLARVDVPYKRTFARGVLAGYMFPPILLGIPMFIIWSDIGMLNSRIGLIFAQTALALPFSLWLMWKFFQSVPYSLEESAQMSGASRFQAFYDVALPMAVPGIIAVVIYAFAVSWNDFTLARILLSDQDLFPLTLGLNLLIDDRIIPWGPMMASVFLTIVPAFALVYFLQKYLLEGFRVS